MADMFFREGKFDLAIYMYENMLAASPAADPRVPYSMGNAYYGKEDYKTALRYYEQSARLVPGYANVWHAIGFCHVMLGQMDSAFCAFYKAIALDSRYEKVYSRMSLVHYINPNALRDPGDADKYITDPLLKDRLMLKADMPAF